MCDRGIKYRDNVGVIWWANMLSVLIELAFIGTAADAVILKEKQDEMAQAMAKGFYTLGENPERWQKQMP